VEKEFGPAFIDFCFNWFKAFSCVGEELQVRCICSCLGGGVGHKHYSVVASDMCKNKGQHSNISGFRDCLVDEFEGVVSGLDGIGDWHCNVDNYLPLSVRQGFRNDGGRCRFLVFACDSHKRFFMLAHTGIEVISPSQICSWVSPDIQGFLWAWGSG
jgi:hypothetical protein